MYVCIAHVVYVYTTQRQYVYLVCHTHHAWSKKRTLVHVMIRQVFKRINHYGQPVPLTHKQANTKFKHEIQTCVADTSLSTMCLPCLQGVSRVRCCKLYCHIYALVLHIHARCLVHKRTCMYIWDPIPPKVYSRSSEPRK